MSGRSAPKGRPPSLQRLTMTRDSIRKLLIALATLPGMSFVQAIASSTTPPLPSGTPSAIVDLATREGVALVRGAWRYSDTKIVEVDFRGPGADGQPNGAPVTTYDYIPHAGGMDFDDSAWSVIDASTLQQRRGVGRLGFNWYRIGITVPPRIGDFDPSGSTAVFETSLDDYAEIWVNGELPRAVGQSGGSVISGWNARNRVVIGRNIHPGDHIQLAIFGINGPISNPPTNFIWMRYARLEFYKDAPAVPLAIPPSEVNVDVNRVDPAVDDVVPVNAKVYKLAEGFKFTEGPIWFREGKYLLFS